MPPRKSPPKPKKPNTGAQKRKAPAKPRTKATGEGIAPTAFVSEELKPRAPYTAVNRMAYSPELGQRICELLVERDDEDKTRSLRDVCSFDGMPSESAVYAWLNKHEEFAEIYARARETLAEMNANDILRIADTATDANIARVRIDARKWWAAKVNPKKYGDKIGVSGDGDGGPIRFEDMSRFSDDQLRNAIATTGLGGTGAPGAGSS